MGDNKSALGDTFPAGTVFVNTPLSAEELAQLRVCDIVTPEKEAALMGTDKYTVDEPK